MTSSSSGIGFLGLLTVVFVVLKLIDKIQWSWLWVLSPLWLPDVAVIVILTLAWAFYQIHKLSICQKKK